MNFLNEIYFGSMEIKSQPWETENCQTTIQIRIPPLYQAYFVFLLIFKTWYYDIKAVSHSCNVESEITLFMKLILLFLQNWV